MQNLGATESLVYGNKTEFIHRVSRKLKCLSFENINLKQGWPNYGWRWNSRLMFGRPGSGSVAHSAWLAGQVGWAAAETPTFKMLVLSGKATCGFPSRSLATSAVVHVLGPWTPLFCNSWTSENYNMWFRVQINLNKTLKLQKRVTIVPVFVYGCEVHSVLQKNWANRGKVLLGSKVEGRLAVLVQLIDLRTSKQLCYNTSKCILGSVERTNRHQTLQLQWTPLQSKTTSHKSILAIN